jgi:hypothetical protein
LTCATSRRTTEFIPFLDYDTGAAEAEKAGFSRNAVLCELGHCRRDRIHYRLRVQGVLGLWSWNSVRIETDHENARGRHR